MRTFLCPGLGKGSCLLISLLENEEMTIRSPVTAVLVRESGKGMPKVMGLCTHETHNHLNIVCFEARSAASLTAAFILSSFNGT